MTAPDCPRCEELRGRSVAMHEIRKGSSERLVVLCYECPSCDHVIPLAPFSAPPSPSPEALALVFRIRNAVDIRDLPGGAQDIVYGSTPKEAAIGIDRIAAEAVAWELEKIAALVWAWEGHRYDLVAEIRARGDTARPAEPPMKP